MNPDIQSIIHKLSRIEQMLEEQFLPEFLTVSEAAKLLRCSKSKIRSLLNSGELPFKRLGASFKCTLLIKQNDIRKMIK